jgi:hypothetical protein
MGIYDIIVISSQFADLLFGEIFQIAGEIEMTSSDSDLHRSLLSFLRTLYQISVDSVSNQTPPEKGRKKLFFTSFLISVLSSA